MAFPRPTIANDEALVDQLRTLVEEERVGVIVVGRPLSLKGRETSSTREADELFERLVGAFGEEMVHQWDERLTTVEAQRSLTQAGIRAKDHRERVDGAAAVVMLQNYLDGLSAD